MTSPLHDGSRTPAGPARTPADHARARVKVARKWAYLLSSSTYLPFSQQEIDQAMHELVDVVFNAALSEPFNADLATGVGTRLVDMRCTGPTSLRRTIDVLGKALLSEPELYRIDDKREERAVQLLGVIASDYLEAARQFIFTQQEDIKEALVRAGSDAQRQARATQARFDAIFTSSPSGIAIVELTGAFVRANPALQNMLDRTDFDDVTLFDVVDPDEAPFLKAACRDLADGWAERLHQQRRLIRQDGEAVRASMSITVLRDNGSTPTHLLVSVHDETEMSLLQGQLSHQSLHDVLTGLPNRQYFSTRLESVLRQADPDIGATLYHLDLDAFSMITDGLGRSVGDRVLMNVAQRLRAVVAGENAMVARFDGDEFAIIVQNSETTPDLVSMIASINEELAEPIYFDGRGVAASASIGVVHKPPADADVNELLRTADMTLRRAKANGRRQWGLFDSAEDARDRSRFSLAAQMPGALEMGEITVVCRPLIRLSDGGRAGFEALLRWEHESEVISHSLCLELAEQTGLIVPLRDTLLDEAGKQVQWWNTEHGTALPLTMALTANQACDPDLVGAVLIRLTEAEMDPSLLRISMPASVLLADRGESVDNFRVLADNGITMEVHDFGSAAGDIECLEDLPASSARIAPRLVERLRSGKSSLITRTLTDLIEVAHLAGAAITVDGIETAEQADWWREIGADTALGRYFAPEPADLHELDLSSWNVPGPGSARR
ncbi:putative bifunctional diguanylate cyclase/phosphodiesterase [Kibdelosporangium aridum]|uniref:PAS domain S-box-containing protein/diguanylate cyclase (GGDEF) domain-containing protein n=1 Tax=Kibdelosporangium aridum TaxID=2030 RepID=A0A1W2FGD2_KIBAR|nr:diguanylate cyclase [Kibdelosporangium aridum]SMD20732.1 PAS domain S-box-containing protein/diguanylate cyclase (GGDEF) domain-containing protein [Kibdelosporangium aridum]